MSGVLGGLIGTFARQVPNAPINVNATDVGTGRAFNNGAAQVEWTPGSGAAATSFTVTSSPGGLTASSGASPLTITGLQSNTTYTYTVTATNAVGTSSPSSASNSVLATTVPQTPTSLVATAGDGQAIIIYNAGADGGKPITSYIATSSPGGIIGFGDNASLFVGGLTNGVSYTFTATATNDNGSVTSAPSNSVIPQKPVQEWVGIGHGTPNRFNIHPWTDSTGFGSVLSAPTGIPAAATFGRGITWTSDNAVVALVYQNAAPGIAAYPWSDAGFGSKFTDPASGMGAGVQRGPVFHPTDTSVVAFDTNSPNLSAWAFSKSTGFGTRFANTSPATATGNGVWMNPAGNAVAQSRNSTPFVEAFAYSTTTGFGTKFANPATLPNGAGSWGSWDRSGNIFVHPMNPTPFVAAYNWSASGFGTRLANPASLPNGAGQMARFNPSNNVLSVSNGQSPFAPAVYAWSASGFGTRFGTASNAPNALSAANAWSNQGGALLFTQNSTPFIRANFWNGDYSGAYSQPATLPTGSGIFVNFSYRL